MVTSVTSSSLSTSWLKLFVTDGFGRHLLGSLQVVKGGTVGGGTGGQQPAGSASNGWLLCLLTVPLVLVDLADEEDGLLIHSHAVLVGAKQLLHVLF